MVRYRSGAANILRASAWPGGFHDRHRNANRRFPARCHGAPKCCFIFLLFRSRSLDAENRATKGSTAPGSVWFFWKRSHRWQTQDSGDEKRFRGERRRQQRDNLRGSWLMEPVEENSMRIGA